MNSELLHKHRLHRLCLVMVQWIPVFGAILMCLRCLLLILGFNTDAFEFVMDSCLCSYIMLIFASYALELCHWHRLCVTYIYAMSICADIQRCIGWGEWLFAARLTMLFIGVVIIVMFLMNHKRI